MAYISTTPLHQLVPYSGHNGTLWRALSRRFSPGVFVIIRDSSTTGMCRFLDAIKIVRAPHSHSNSSISHTILVPGCLMAAARHNRPTIVVYGGTIQPGTAPQDCPSLNRKAGDPLNIGDGFEAYGASILIDLICDYVPSNLGIRT